MKERIINALEANELDDSHKIRSLKNKNVGDFVINCEESEGGYEGGGEVHWIVISVKRGEDLTYWHIPGEYYSHYGSDIYLNNMTRVAPKEKIITVFEPI